MAYAVATKVTVSNSRSAIEAMLRKAGATRIITMDERLESVVAFELAERLIKIHVPIAGDISDQRRRSLWRSLHLIIRAKLEAVAEKVTTVEQEFLAHVVMPEGQTVGEWIRPQLAIAYKHDQGVAHGDMPRMLIDRTGKQP